MADRKRTLHAAYLMYQLDWLRSHSNFGEVFDEVAEWYEDDDEWDENDPIDLQSLPAHIEEQGLYGQCYVCLREFEEYEYRDTQYMRRLLEGYPALLEDWEKTIGKNLKS